VRPWIRVSTYPRIPDRGIQKLISNHLLIRAGRQAGRAENPSGRPHLQTNPDNATSPWGNGPCKPWQLMRGRKWVKFQLPASLSGRWATLYHQSHCRTPSPYSRMQGRGRLIELINPSFPPCPRLDRLDVPRIALPCFAWTRTRTSSILFDGFPPGTMPMLSRFPSPHLTSLSS
jgi:hypothetical protein